MPEENINQEFRLKKKIDEIRNYLTEEIYRHELMGKKHNVYRVLNYIYHSLIVIPIITGYVSNSDFSSLVVILIRITSSGTG